MARFSGEKTDEQSTSDDRKARPFLRWSGGKRRLLEKLMQLRPPHFETYHEPFVGGGCMFFAVDARKACLSDINPQVVRAYKGIQSDAGLVAALLAGIPHHVEAFHELRQLDPSTCSDHEAAARLIFLMKSCFNGVYRENLASVFNTPWGGKVFKLPDLPSLLAVQRKLKGVVIEQSDFARVADRATCEDFVYLDPPYPQRRYRGEFGRNFTNSDVDRLIALCHGLDDRGVKVMLSYVVDERLAPALKRWRVVEVQSTRSVASLSRFRGSDSERVYLNY